MFEIIFAVSKCQLPRLKYIFIRYDPQLLDQDVGSRTRLLATPAGARALLYTGVFRLAASLNPRKPAATI